MYLVEEIRLASPTQLAALQRRKALFRTLEMRAVKPKELPVKIDHIPKPEEIPIAPEQTTRSLPKRVAGLASTVADVIMDVCGSYYGLTVADVKGRVRKPQHCKARHATFFVMSKATGWSLPEIGRRVGMRDHTTVLHGLRKLERLRKDSEFAGILDGLVAQARDRLEGGSETAVPAVSEQHVPEQVREGADSFA